MAITPQQFAVRATSFGPEGSIYVFMVAIIGGEPHRFRPLIDLYRQTDHEVDEGNILNTIAAVYHSMGDNDRAIAAYRRDDAPVAAAASLRSERLRLLA